ncbi:MAG: hypothetical protein WAP51_04330 [Candidatus Sungiibacteriota bacterium]
MMKAFVAAIIVLIIFAFTLTDLPKDLARRIQDSADINGFIKERVLSPLAQNFAGGKNPEELRLDLIDKIGGSLEALKKELQENQLPKAGAGKIATSTASVKGSPIELINQAQDLLEELKSRNADEGFLKNTAEKIISKTLPSSNVCVKEPEE